MNEPEASATGAPGAAVAAPRITRLVGLASAVTDLVLHVDHLPEPGGDVLATSSELVAGGGIHALRSAAAAGLPVAYAGAHGTGPFGDVVRAALASLGAEVLLPPTSEVDTGVCVVLVDRTGERTFATTVGAEGHLTSEVLHGVSPAPGDGFYISGYDLAYPHGAVVAAFVNGLPAATPLLFDPGPLIQDLDPALLRQVLDRTSWLSLTAREERSLSRLADLTPAVVVVRDGARGAWLREDGHDPVQVPAVALEWVRDTNGAGDVHVGAFLAALARGLTPGQAVAAANEAAALHLGRRA